MICCFVKAYYIHGMNLGGGGGFLGYYASNPETFRLDRFICMEILTD